MEQLVECARKRIGPSLQMSIFDMDGVKVHSSIQPTANQHRNPTKGEVDDEKEEKRMAQLERIHRDLASSHQCLLQQSMKTELGRISNIQHQITESGVCLFAFEWEELFYGVISADSNETSLNSLGAISKHLIWSDLIGILDKLRN